MCVSVYVFMCLQVGGGKGRAKMAEGFWWLHPVRSGWVGSGPVQIHLVYTSCKCIQDHKICLFCSLILHSSLTIVLIIIIIIVVICVSI